MTMKWILPLRFVSLVAHLVLAILFLSNRDYNVRVCLPWNHTEDQYWSKDKELIAGLSLSIAFLVIEILAFLTGISMLHSKQSLYSLSMHTVGSLSMLSFLLEGWECSLFWWIFVVTIIGPLLTEMYIVLRTLFMSNYGAVGGPISNNNRHHRSREQRQR